MNRTDFEIESCNISDNKRSYITLTDSVVLTPFHSLTPLTPQIIQHEPN